MALEGQSRVSMWFIGHWAGLALNLIRVRERVELLYDDMTCGEFILCLQCTEYRFLIQLRNT